MADKDRLFSKESIDTPRGSISMKKNNVVNLQIRQNKRTRIPTGKHGKPQRTPSKAATGVLALREYVFELRELALRIEAIAKMADTAHNTTE